MRSACVLNMSYRTTARNGDQTLGDGKLMPGNRDMAPPPNKRARKENEIMDKVMVLLVRPSRVNSLSQVPTDFFGRPILNADGSAKKPPSKKGPVVKAYRVSYKFNEGNSAAVRKPVKVSAFL